jgi:hypothetical protein
VADETDFRLYLVEHDLGGLSAAQLAAVHRMLGEAVGREVRRGSRIRYVQRIDVPGEDRCLCLSRPRARRWSGPSMTSRSSHWHASSRCSARRPANDASAWLPASAESVKVLDVQTRLQPPSTYPAVVVYYRASGLTAADRAKAAADARRFAGLPGALPGQVAGPIPSADGAAMQTIVPVNVGAKGYNGAIARVASMRAMARAGANGLTSHITGLLGYAADSAKKFTGLTSTLPYAALAVVIVILLISYRSPVLWILPVTSSVVALITAEAVACLLAAHAGLTVNQESAAILAVLVFGAGTDYALLLVARYREELRRHNRRPSTWNLLTGPSAIGLAILADASRFPSHAISTTCVMPGFQPEGTPR